MIQYHMLHNIISCKTILYITISYETVSYDTILSNTAIYILHEHKHSTDDNEKISP